MSWETGDHGFSVQHGKINGDWFTTETWYPNRMVCIPPEVFGIQTKTLKVETSEVCAVCWCPWCLWCYQCSVDWTCDCGCTHSLDLWSGGGAAAPTDHGVRGRLRLQAVHALGACRGGAQQGPFGRTDPGQGGAGRRRGLEAPLQSVRRPLADDGSLATAHSLLVWAR